MDRKFHMINPVEAVVIGVILLGSAAAIFIMNHSGKDSRTPPGLRVAVIQCGDIRYELSLDEEDSLFRFDGVDASFEVKNGEIRIIEATCPDKICEKTGFIGSAGQSIICVPNKITVSIVGSEEGVDVTVG